MATAQVSVSVEEAYRDRFAEVIERARKAGLKVEQELREIGIITGSIEADKLDDLERVEGVRYAEAARTIQIPPPESELQ